MHLQETNYVWLQGGWGINLRNLAGQFWREMRTCITFDRCEELLQALIQVKEILPLITPFMCVKLVKRCIVPHHAVVTVHVSLMKVIL